ncbi:MAG: SDR family oxidoreductase [Anaerolineaceae bacterium]|nr:SDR family oxidoreductase [Anaerolineaceae bacterium]
MFEGRFRGKRAIVTGASKGIGRAAAIRLAKEGGCVALISRSKADLEEVAALIKNEGGEAYVFTADVSKEDQLQAAIDGAVQAMGGLDIVVSNAGIELPFEDNMTDSLPYIVWDRIISTNLTGQFLTCKHGVRHLLDGKKGGAVVMVGSPCGEKGFCFKEHAYSASKGGIMSLMKVMAIDYAPYNIRVNACIPGFIDTPMNAHVMGDPELLKTWSNTIPMKRPGTSEETAAVILFLASDEASYVLGSAFVVDGGQIAT